MVQGQGNLSTSVVIAGMIGIGIVGFAIDVLLRAVEAAFRRKWGQA